MGTHQKPVDFELLEKLCQMQCTQEEIASILNLSIETVSARVNDKYKIDFSEYYKQKSSVGKASLRRVQFQKAIDGDNTMLIWLGKQYLKQAEKSETETEIKHKIELINKIEASSDEELIEKAREAIKLLEEKKK